VANSGKQRTRRSTGTNYRIVARGELSRRYEAAFEGMEMETQAGRTILTGVLDQPHLHGILTYINGLGLHLLSVESSLEEKVRRPSSRAGAE
jgi:hypothetical protein